MKTMHPESEKHVADWFETFCSTKTCPMMHSLIDVITR